MFGKPIYIHLLHKIKVVPEIMDIGLEKIGLKRNIVYRFCEGSLKTGQQANLILNFIHFFSLLKNLSTSDSLQMC